MHHLAAVPWRVARAIVRLRLVFWVSSVMRSSVAVTALRCLSSFACAVCSSVASRCWRIRPSGSSVGPARWAVTTPRRVPQAGQSATRMVYRSWSRCWVRRTTWSQVSVMSQSSRSSLRTWVDDRIWLICSIWRSLMGGGGQQYPQWAARWPLRLQRCDRQVPWRSRKSASARSYSVRCSGVSRFSGYQFPSPSSRGCPQPRHGSPASSSARLR